MRLLIILLILISVVVYADKSDINKIKSILKDIKPYYNNLVLPQNLDLIKQKDKKLYVDILTEYIKKYPNNPTNYRVKFLLGYHYYDEKDYMGAVKYFEDIIGVYTELQDYVLFYLGESYQILKEYEKAYRAYSLIDKDSVFYERAVIRKLNILFDLKRYGYIKILFENNRDLLENSRLNMIYAKSLIEVKDYENAIMQLKKLWFQSYGKERKNIENILNSFKKDYKIAIISNLEYYNRCEYLLQKNRYHEIKKTFKLSYSLNNKLKLNTDICLIKAYLFSNDARREIPVYIKRLASLKIKKDSIFTYNLKFLEILYSYVSKNYNRVIDESLKLLKKYPKYPNNEKIYKLLIDSFKKSGNEVNYHKYIERYLNTEYEKYKLDFLDITWRYYYFKLHNYKKSINYIKKYLKEEHDDLRYENRAKYYLGKSYLKLKDYDKAIYNFIKMMVQDPFGYYSYAAFEGLKSLKNKISKDVIIKAISDVKNTVVKIDIEKFYNNPEIAKIYELLTLRLMKEVKTEILSFQKKAKNETEFFATALFFENLKFYKSSRNVKFKTLRMIPFFPDKKSFLSFWRSFYPLKFKNYVISYSRKFNVDPYFSWGIIREESAYNPEALSSSNAYGLMQLLFPTALETAQRIGLSLNNPEELFLPEKNIPLGIKYLSVLLNMFKGNKFYAAASYNGGATNVKKWIKTYNHHEDIYDWSEEIPFEETNRYIYKVLSSYHAYKLLYRKNYFKIGKINILDEVFK